MGKKRWKTGGGWCALESPRVIIAAGRPRGARDRRCPVSPPHYEHRRGGTCVVVVVCVRETYKTVFDNNVMVEKNNNNNPDPVPGRAFIGDFASPFPGSTFNAGSGWGGGELTLSELGWGACPPQECVRIESRGDFPGPI